jgi:hypothetical protein
LRFRIPTRDELTRYAHLTRLKNQGNLTNEESAELTQLSERLNNSVLQFRAQNPQLVSPNSIPLPLPSSSSQSPPVTTGSNNNNSGRGRKRKKTQQPPKKESRQKIGHNSQVSAPHESVQPGLLRIEANVVGTNRDGTSFCMTTSIGAHGGEIYHLILVNFVMFYHKGNPEGTTKHWVISDDMFQKLVNALKAQKKANITPITR